MSVHYISKHFFDAWNWLPALGWAVLVTIGIILVTLNYSRKDKRLFVGLFFFKLLFVSAFITYYVFILHGGDTLGYWVNSIPLSNIFRENPSRYFELLLQGDPKATYYSFFDMTTGFPWVGMFGRVGNFITVKITSILYIICFGSYLAGTLIMVFISTLVHWKLYQLLIKHVNFSRQRFQFLFLFIPSFPFWCAGVAKDTYMGLIIFGIAYIFFYFIYEKKYKVHYFLLLALLFFLGYRIRSVILYATLFPFLIVFVIHSINKVRISYFRVTLKTILTVVVVAGITYYLSRTGIERLLKNNDAFSEAIVKQKDFATNIYYGDNQYYLGFTTYSLGEIIQKAPLVIISGIYRPFIWEAFSIALIINGLESIVFIVFSFPFLYRRIKYKWFKKKEQAIGNYAGIFVLLFGFVIGFTAILYGVLVRLRAPLIPFLGILLSLKSEEEIQKSSLANKKGTIKDNTLEDNKNQVLSSFSMDHRE